MPYLVRKLNKSDVISSLYGEIDITRVPADLPTTEFRTKCGTLSTWQIDSLDDLDNAVLAIAVTSSEITKMDFIIIETDILQDNNLKYKPSYAGQDIAVLDLQDTHYDIIEITLEKLVNCTKVYKTIVDKDPNRTKYIIRYEAGKIKDLLKKAMEKGRIDESKITTKRIKEYLDKIKPS